MLLSELMPNGMADCPACKKRKKIHVFGGNLVVWAGDRYMDMQCLTCKTIFRRFLSYPGEDEKPDKILEEN